MKPFKVNETPNTNTNETKSVVVPPPGKQIVHSRQTGDPLPTPSTESPDHNPTIPWPQPANGVDHKPFKTNQ